MDQVLKGIGKFALPYHDDVSVFSDSWIACNKYFCDFEMPD